MADLLVVFTAGSGSGLWFLPGSSGREPKLDRCRVAVWLDGLDGRGLAGPFVPIVVHHSGDPPERERQKGQPEDPRKDAAFPFDSVDLDFGHVILLSFPSDTKRPPPARSQRRVSKAGFPERYNGYNPGGSDAATTVGTPVQ